MIADLIAGPNDSATLPDPSRRDHPVMTRRTLLVTLAGSILAVPLAAEAQQAQGPKAAKIGFLLGGTLSTPSVQMEPFKQTLREREWIEGRNLTLEYRTAEGHYERLPALARELVVRGIDVIVTDGTPQTRATIEVTKTTPVVMATTGDPMASGLVSSLAHPGGNRTGASFFVSEINAKRLELLKEADPHIVRVAVIYNPLNSAHERAVVAIEVAAKTQAPDPASRGPRSQRLRCGIRGDDTSAGGRGIQ
jgi:putative tryptophan/tyrosine transport system substrate-binding protein